MSTTAGTLVNNVRDEIPDPTSPYGDATADGGLLRAATLYRWLDSGVKVMARACGALIEDWTAIAQVAGQPNYSVDPLWGKITDGVSNLWPLDTISILEGDTIWPSGEISAQSLAGFYHVKSDHLEFGLFPVPSVSDPATTLTNAAGISASDTSLTVAASTSFLAYGYLLIGTEIIRYDTLSGLTCSLLTRGACGTTAATHALGATVQHLGLWLKGTRSPAAITGSTSIVELPLDIASHLSTYLLARARRAENEHAEARALMGDFEKACAEIRGDPTRKVSQGIARAYGEPRVGPVYFPRVSGGVIFR